MSGEHRDLQVHTRIAVTAPVSKRAQPQLNSPRRAARFMRYLASYDQEAIAVVSLDAKSRPLSVFRAATGGTKSVRVAMQHVLKVPVLASAAKVLLYHNHPSGDPRPSPADEAFYRRAVAAFELVGPRLVDSIVVAAGGYWSLRVGAGSSWSKRRASLASVYPLPASGEVSVEEILTPSELDLVRAISDLRARHSERLMRGR